MLTFFFFFFFPLFYLIATRMGERDLNLNPFYGKLWEVPMSPQISITLEEEKKVSFTFNVHYINSWKIWLFFTNIFP